MRSHANPRPARPAPTPTRTPVLALCLGLLMAVSACSSSSPAAPEPEEETPPAVVEIAPASLPPYDTELYKTSCQTASGACPAVRWQGIDYVALSYRDNRFAFAIHAFDASGGTRGVMEAPGARYAAGIDVDPAARTVTFVGQADQAVTLAWSDLEGIR